MYYEDANLALRSRGSGRIRGKTKAKQIDQLQPGEDKAYHGTPGIYDLAAKPPLYHLSMCLSSGPIKTFFSSGAHGVSMQTSVFR